MFCGVLCYYASCLLGPNLSRRVNVERANVERANVERANVESEHGERVISDEGQRTEQTSQKMTGPDPMPAAGCPFW